jgi:hypothetical protein
MVIRCIVIDVLLLRVLAPAGMCLPSRCLSMGLYVTICRPTDWLSSVANLKKLNLSAVSLHNLHLKSTQDNTLKTRLASEIGLHKRET